ncbi:putative late blight resistance protein homolog R1B-17 [Solanum lycopersicum]|uniref:NB-ARC domain-containing protein n=1 Tax=Solanum lycopersicum TaxID=4081 RepID=A0A3Q7G059_SOLLC|nr:putative late blight resistance protein homolog R1B-17 [Solanum lycopersicum]XP_019068867.1 putative late blight resistance protein homolog R1B-17 [Solanum lycopersicum]
MEAIIVAAVSPAATKAVSFLVDSLSQLLSENVELIRGADRDFQRLLDEIEPINELLAGDYAQLKSNNNDLDKLFQNIQRTVYKAEDAIDKFLIQAKIDEANFFNKIGPFVKWNNNRKIAPEFGKILEQVTEIRKQTQQVLEKTGIQSSAFQPGETTQPQGPAEEDVEVVGFNKPAEDVKERLCEGSKDLDVIPIVGMPGLGKTTLSRKVYNDSSLDFYFYHKIWIYVGTSKKPKDILVEIVKEVAQSNSKELIKDKDEDQLAHIIRDFLVERGKHLIVLDDVWDTQVVDFVKKAFPNKKSRPRGDRIMLTTRQQRVAEAVSARPHYLENLSKEDSIKLLEQRVFANKRTCPIELQGYRDGIVDKCCGVPLAIVVISGALRGCMDESEWRVVEENVGKHLINKDDHKSCLKFVETSYNHLPQEKKAAFLYFGVFPQGFDIPAWNLIRLWVAEGLIKSGHKDSEIEKVAETYLSDFASRNLVMVMQKRSNGQIKTCRLHDMLHEFCIIEAARISLFQQVYLQPGVRVFPSIEDPNTSRRLCIQSSIPYNFIPKDRIVQHVRSLLCFSSDQKQIDLSNLDVQLIPSAFPLIRVLDIQSLIFEFSKMFYGLFHLRYIAIKGDFTIIPSLFRNFWYLQTLILRNDDTNTSSSTLEIKEDIWKLLQLRHLHSDLPVKLPPPPTTTSNSRTSCLQTLSKVTPDSCKKTVFAKACHLRKLGIEGKLALLLGKERGFDSFQELRCIEKLKLLNNDFSEELHLPPHFFSLQKTLNKLTLSSTRFKWSEADMLGQLECLKVLKLKENAFTGKKWKPKKGSFSKLQVLHIVWAGEWETWDASNRPFQSLTHLALISCYDLKAVPHELADLPYLQEMKLTRTFQAVSSAIEIKNKILQRQDPESSIKFNLITFPPTPSTN